MRPLRLVAFVTCIKHQACLLRGYHQKAAAYYRTCMHSRYVRYVYVYYHTSHRAQALALVFIWLAAPRGAVDFYVSLCFGPI
jgi:hypothetical protein